MESVRHSPVLYHLTVLKATDIYNVHSDLLARGRASHELAAMCTAVARIHTSSPTATILLQMVNVKSGKILRRSFITFLSPSGPSGDWSEVLVLFAIRRDHLVRNGQIPLQKPSSNNDA